MDDMTVVLKAVADQTRLKIVNMLLRRNYCVRALARHLGLTESAVSQHLKVLRDAGLLRGKKKGYFMHYDVNRDALHELAADIEALSCIEREICTPETGGCSYTEQERCHVKNQNCSDEVREYCHGKDSGKGENSHEQYRHCNCQKSK